MKGNVSALIHIAPYVYISATKYQSGWKLHRDTSFTYSECFVNGSLNTNQVKHSNITNKQQRKRNIIHLKCIVSRLLTSDVYMLTDQDVLGSTVTHGCVWQLHEFTECHRHTLCLSLYLCTLMMGLIDPNYKVRVNDL